MKQSRFIEQIMVIGEGEKMPAAFIQPNFEFLKDWAERKGLQIGGTMEEMISNPTVIERYQEEIDEHNEKFGKWRIV